MTVPQKNLIVVGDSFCASAAHWPQQLADALDLNLMCHTQGAGQAWWDARYWLEHVPQAHWEQTTTVVFAHTNAERIPTDCAELVKIDHSARPTTEMSQAVCLYYKYIFHTPFMHWAQQAWFREISQKYSNFKLVHLHCFPWSVQYSDQLTGLNITTNLSAISLNELCAQEMTLYNDSRPNHLNAYNNQQLAQQLATLIQQGVQGDHALDTEKFSLKCQDWFTRSDWK
jgi:hypothetical protein